MPMTADRMIGTVSGWPFAFAIWESDVLAWTQARAPRTRWCRWLHRRHWYALANFAQRPICLVCVLHHRGRAREALACR
jgi:hypothetical protein